jgi:predicted aldo/keto reductase-like oxidoreductase
MRAVFVVPAGSASFTTLFDRLREQRKTRFLGLTAVGDTAALHQVIDARAFDSAQVVYNMPNPSAAAALPAAMH